MKLNPFIFSKSLFQYLRKDDLSSDEKKDIEEIINKTPSIQKLYNELQNKDEVNSQLSIITSFDVDVAYEKVNRKNRSAFFIRIAATVALIIITFLAYWVTNDDEYNSDLIGKGKTMFKTSDGNIVSLDTLTDTKVSNHLLLQNEQGILVINERTAERKNNNKSNVIDVPYKGMYTVKLPDGTKVHLNSGSTLEFSDNFDLNERVVYLNGEALFDVVKSKGKPFIVKTKNISIKVLGTQFNIKSYDNDLNAYATLIEGEIELLDEHKEHKILPGEQIVFNKTNKVLDIKQVDIKPITAWSDNVFYFDNTPLDEIMKRLSRWYDLKIRYQDDDPDIKSITYSGKIKMYSHPEDVLRKFEKTGELKFELRKNTIIISRK